LAVGGGGGRIKSLASAAVPDVLTKIYKVGITLVTFFGYLLPR
jgi:hypothetical protein